MFFQEEDIARGLFNKRGKENPPETPSLQRDWQQSKEYRWEYEALYKSSPRISIEQMERVVRRISDDFNIAAPTIRYRKPHPTHKNPSSSYDSDLDKILMKHKEMSFVIHELAHAIDEKINGNKWSAHSPSFVRTVIHLAERYQFWHDPKVLEAKAIELGLQIAPESSLPALPPSFPRPG